MTEIKFKRYGMYTDRGNAMIEGVIMTARAAKMSAADVIDLLWTISKTEEYNEASDTYMRDVVLSELGL